MMPQKSTIWTEKEIGTIKKKLGNEKLTQVDSNYLSRFVRPKLKEMAEINAKELLNKLKYNQKAVSIERKIKQIILKQIKDISSITIYGSAIQNNYVDYNDIDVLVIVKKKFWRKLGEKYKKIFEIRNIFKKYSISLDLELYEKKVFETAYSSNISLIYQLNDRKVIYGELCLPPHLYIPKIELRMKADYSIIEQDSRGIEIYKAIRNLILIILILRKIVDNRKLVEMINEEIGKSLACKLKTNTELSIERKIAMLYLQKLLERVLKELKEARWEKIELLNH